jgi:transposase
MNRYRNEGSRRRAAKPSAVNSIKEVVMATEAWRVPDSLWRELEPLIPAFKRRFRYPGRKRYEDRACLEGILYVLRHGVPWRALPRLHGMPSGQTCWRRLDEWERAGVWAKLLERLQERLAEAERIDWSRAIVDASLVDAKRGARRSHAAFAAAPAAVSTL